MTKNGCPKISGQNNNSTCSTCQKINLAKNRPFGAKNAKTQRSFQVDSPFWREKELEPAPAPRSGAASGCAGRPAWRIPGRGGGGGGVGFGGRPMRNWGRPFGCSKESSALLVIRPGFQEGQGAQKETSPSLVIWFGDSEVRVVPRKKHTSVYQVFALLAYFV